MPNAADVVAVAGAQRPRIGYPALDQPLATSPLPGRNTGIDTAGRSGLKTSGTARLVAANTPPATGGYVADDRAVAVIITSP